MCDRGESGIVLKMGIYWRRSVGKEKVRNVFLKPIISGSLVFADRSANRKLMRRDERKRLL